MEAVAQQLKSINSVIGELKDEMRALKDNVEDRFKQLETNVNKLEAKIDSKTDEMTKEMDGLRPVRLNNNDEAVGRQSDVELMKAIELAYKENKEKIQTIESLSTEMFERIFHNESSLKLKMEQMSATMASMTLMHKSLDVQKFEGSNHAKTETYDWAITDVNNRFQRETGELQSPIFTFIGYEFDIKAKIKNTDGKLEIWLQFKDGNKINEFVHKDGFTTVTYIVKDQVNTRENKDIAFLHTRENKDIALQYSITSLTILEKTKTSLYMVPLTFNRRFGTKDWIFGKLLPNAILCPPYTKDNCIKISMLFEPASIDRSFVSDNGVLMWTVDNYKTKKQEQLHSLVWSPTFYTSPRGYRVRMRLALDEDSMGVSVHFLTGEHDDSLSIDFPHTTTVTLFNQSDPSKNLVMFEQTDYTGFKTVHIGSCQLIEHDGFIKDDSLLLKVAIEPAAYPSNCHPPLVPKH